MERSQLSGVGDEPAGLAARRVNTTELSQAVSTATTLEQTIALIATIAPFFAQFEGFWPVHDMIGTYLINMQNRRRRDLRKEKEADERDARSDVNEDESSDDDIEDLEEDGSDQEAEPPRAPKRKSNAKCPVAKKRVDSDSNLADADDEEEDEDTFHKKQDDKKDDSQTRRRAPLAERSSQQVQINSRVIRSLSSPELPSGCPVKDCLDYVPEESSRRLLYLFSERHHLIREGADGSEFADLQICAALEQQKDVTRFIKLGRQNNWPQIIDYPAVIDRILSLRKILLALIRHEELLLKCDIWNAFLQTIDYKICEFSASSHKKDYVYAMYERRCGYYGPQGQLLINSTIAQMLWDDEEDLSYDLCNTLHNVISADRDKYDDVDDSRDHLMPLDAFIFFILTPFTAVLSIAQDMKVDLDKAGDIRDASSEFGDVIQPLQFWTGQWDRTVNGTVASHTGYGYPNP
ncbi:hypothetical protein C8R45DRAFT_1107983 [Mycena sanguinolenta]|nr:hypothetical protein C8R45DRAFT_1107983 [Mycena sanguinolenta]